MNESTKIIENGFVFTGDKQHHARRLTLLVQKGRIVDIGKPVQVLKTLHPSAEIINAADKVLLPGFVDAHTHLVFAGNRANVVCRHADP